MNLEQEQIRKSQERSVQQLLETYPWIIEAMLHSMTNKELVKLARDIALELQERL